MSDSRRDQYAAATRAALLDAARHAFLADGYAATSLDAVVRAAGVTKGALYHHFDNKEALLAEVVAGAEDEAGARVAELLAGEVDARGRLLACLRGVVEASSDPVYRELVSIEAPAAGLAVGDGLLAPLRRVLEEMVAAGELEPVPAELLGRILLGAAAEAGRQVAVAADPAAVRRNAAALLLRLLGGLRRVGNGG